MPAHASVPAANARFCKAASKIGNDASNASGFSRGKAKKLVNQFKAAAKYAPAKVKSAIGNITKLLGVIGGTSNPVDLAKVYTSDAFKNYPTAIGKFFSYQVQECTGT